MALYKSKNGIVCQCHKWKSIINNRTSGKRGCSYCNHGKLCPHNNLTTNCPELVKEWDYERNDRGPETYTWSANEDVWWKCSEGHSYQATINNRTSKNSQCLKCVNKGFSKASIKWLQQIMDNENIIIQHALSEKGEHKIQGVGKVDGFCSSNNAVYEYHGDFWHGNPKKHPPNKVNDKVGKTFGELYNKTILREQAIRDLGYNLIVKWESD